MPRADLVISVLALLVGGTPWAAMLLVGAVAMLLAATGTFVQLLSVAIALILVIDSVTIAALFPLRARQPDAPFRVPLYPVVSTWRCWGRRGQISSLC